jgi:hypothetical protein
MQNLCRKSYCLLARDGFSSKGISDALAGMGEAKYPAGKKIVSEGETGKGF